MKGEFRESKSGTFRYRVPIREGTSIVDILGEIRKKNDGRYMWYRVASKYFPDWNGESKGKIVQGVEDSLGLAKERILAGWINGE